MHYHRTHSDRIRVPHEKRHKSAALGTNGHHTEDDPVKNRLAATAAPALPTKKRKYRKRQAYVDAPAAEVEIMFCPSCLTNLHGVAVGMVMAKAKTKVNGCPKCGLNIKTVAIGMIMDQNRKV